jgi:DNA-binding beta-propeller fold protein YncE
VATDWVGIGDAGRPHAWFYNKADRVTNTQMNVLGLSGNPSVMAVVNEKIYLGGGSVAAVAIAQLSPSQVLLTNIGGSNPVVLPSGSQVNAMTVFGSYIFVAGLNNSPVNVIDTATDTIIASLEAGNGSFGFGSSGRFVYLSNSLSNTVTVIAAREADPSESTPSESTPSVSSPVLAITGINQAQIGVGLAVGSAVLAFGILMLVVRRRAQKRK